jgi:phosphonate transport system permease protein
MSRMPRSSADELRARHPDIFNRPASSRLAIPAMLLLAFAILAFGLVDLDFSPTRLVTGLGQLGWIMLMMLPPDPGASLPLYLKALGETLSIALLGTTLPRFWRYRSACSRRATSSDRILCDFPCVDCWTRFAVSTP